MVPTPYGEEELTVPAGTQGSTVFTSSGRKGTLYVRARVWTPAKLTPELKQLLEQLSEVEGEPPKEGLGQRIWDKMKEAFGT
jgi:DnaJ-class molecular chaperone